MKYYKKAFFKDLLIYIFFVIFNIIHKFFIKYLLVNKCFVFMFCYGSTSGSGSSVTFLLASGIIKTVVIYKLNSIVSSVKKLINIVQGLSLFFMLFSNSFF